MTELIININQKICKLCKEYKDLTNYSKHSGTKDKLDQRCKQCVADTKKRLKTECVSKTYEIYQFNYNSYEWQVGKVGGTIFEYNYKKCKGYKVVFKLNEDGNIKQISKSFSDIEYKTIEKAKERALKYQREFSDVNGFTRNMIRKVDENTIEVQITKENTIVTDIKFLDICQMYTINSTKSGNINSDYYAIICIDNKNIRFHNYITGFEMVDHINRNTLDNRLINLRDTNHKLNNNNRSINKNPTKSGILGVKYQLNKNGNEIYTAYIKQDNKTTGKSFSTKEYGDKAKEMAIKYRKILNEKYNCNNGE